MRRARRRRRADYGALPAAILHFKQLVDLYDLEVWLQYRGWPGEALTGRLVLLRFTGAPSELPEVASGGRNAA